MTSLKKLFEKLNFLNPSRWVWFDSESEPVSSEPEDLQEEGATFEEFMKDLNFLQSTRDRCQTTKEEGGKLIEKQVCSLSETPEELIRFREFVDQLGENFLNTLEGYGHIRDSFDRFQALQEVVDMKTVIELFKKAEAYEVKPGIKGKYPAMILFKFEPDEEYPRGRVVMHPLELSFREKRGILGKGARAILEGLYGRDEENRRQLEEEMLNYEIENIQTHEIAIPMMELKDITDDEIEKNYSEFQADCIKEYKEREQKNIERFERLSDPDEAYQELLQNAYMMEDEFLRDISEPLSRYAEAASHRGLECTKNSCGSYLDPAYREQSAQAMKELMEIAESYLRDYSKGEVIKFTSTVLPLFGIDI